jgi:cytochrome c biogenesis protein CcmG/thiol:disulfide interchange protein DsbE
MKICTKSQWTRFFALLLLTLVATQSAWAVPEIGEPAPALKGTLFSGKAFDLEQMRGKVVLINYYSSYSKQSAFEIGSIEAFLEEHRDKGLVVIYIGVDRPQDRHRVERMVRLYNLDGIMSNELDENGFGEKYRAPRAFVIDRKGIVRSREYGSKTPFYFQQYLAPILEE